MSKVAIGIQARMSSIRFPGKVLKPLQQATLIEHVYRNCAKTGLPTYILTSTEPSDDTLVRLAQNRGWKIFRGDLADVHSRFCEFGANFKLDYILRVSADSPLIHPGVIKLVYMEGVLSNFEPDLITNVFPRTFPKGQSVEMIKTKALASLPKQEMSVFNLEHVTSFFYENSEKFKIVNCQNTNDLSKHNTSVDTPEDLKLLEGMLTSLSINLNSPIPDWESFSSELFRWDLPR